MWTGVAESSTPSKSGPMVQHREHISTPCGASLRLSLVVETRGGGSGDHGEPDDG